MTAAERQRVAEVFSEHIRSQLFLRLQHIPRVFEENGLNKSLYAGIGPKRWIMENFPEFRIDPVNEVVLFAQLPSLVTKQEGVPASSRLSREQHQALADHFQDEISRVGLCWCANVASFMRNNGMPEWRQLVRPGESLPAWLAREFPEFRHDMKNGANAIFPINGGDPQRTTVSDSRLRSISSKFAFFPMRTEVLGQIQRLTGNPFLRPMDWNGLCVQKAANYVLGIDETFLDDSGAPEPRIAFPLGLKTEKEQNIYVVLIPNTNENAPQPWMLGGFCYPGQKDDLNGYGKWLCRAFGLPSEDPDVVFISYEQIQQHTREMNALCTSLLNGLNEFSAALEKGKPLPDNIERQLTAYQKGWDTLREAVENTGVSIPAEKESLAYIGSILDNKSAVSALLDRASGAFETLVRESWNYLVEGWLCNKDRSIEDLDAWVRLMENGGNDAANLIAECRRQLAPFQALRELTRPRDKFDSTVSAAADAANSHFGMELTPSVVRSSFFKVMQNTPNTLDFLDNVGVIENLLHRAETLSAEYCGTRPLSAQTAEGFQKSNSELLRELADGNGRIDAILSSFPRPDPLEQAIMLGQIETVHTLLEDPAVQRELAKEGIQDVSDKLEQLLALGGENSLYSAGMRLLRTVGTRRRQAERCFLTGLALQDTRCVEYLFRIYNETDRNEEIGILYSLYGSQISENLRCEFVKCLLLSGDGDPRQALQTDVIDFLTPEMMERVTTQGGFLPGETVRLLRDIYAKLDIPFVRYVVFLSGELQNYILHPENVKAIQAAGIEQTMEQLVSLTKSGHYSKGRSPLQVAQRVYHFMGAWGRLAETFAALIPEDTSVRSFRLCVARDQKDENQMLRLLQSDPELQAQYWKDYSEILFHQRDYATFLDIVSSHEDSAPEFLFQRVIAAARTGDWDGVLPPFSESGELAGSFHLVLELAWALFDMGYIEQLRTLQTGLFDQMLSLYNSEKLKQFITLDGAMSYALLSALQQQALRTGPMSLAIYCGNVLKIEPTRIAEQSEQYFDFLMQEVQGKNSSDQLSAIQRIQIIFGRQYADHQVHLFPIHFCAMLANPDGAEDENTLPNMLRSDLPEAALHALLDALNGSPAVNALMDRPALYEKLARLCREKGMDILCLCFFHRHRNGRDGVFDRFLCQCYLSALNAGNFPGELLTEAESFALEQLETAQDFTAVMCVYLIETLRGRRLFRAFALCCLQGQLSAEDSDIDNWLRGEIAQFPPDTPVAESAIFAAVLADTESDVYEYLAFCRSFYLLTDEEKDNALQMTRAYATETESILLLHMLYQNFESAEIWAMCARLPFQDRPQVYARLLYCGAQASAQLPNTEKYPNNNEENERYISWQRCVEYCLKNDQNALAFQAMYGWSAEIIAKHEAVFPWYVAKKLIQVIGELCQDNVRDWPADQSRDLVRNLCDIFGRINTADVDDSNHKTLRTINELAVLTGQEDVVLNCSNTLESLLGQNRKLGFVLALRLLQAGRTQKAQTLLQNLMRLRDGMAYPVLADELASKNVQELDEWGQSPVSQALIKAILPDGNTLNGLSIRAMIMEHILNGSCDVGISAIEELLRNNEHDCLLYVALFILCKQDYQNHLPQIYRALAGIYRNYALDERGFERTWCYTRPRKEIFRLLIITRAVVERLGFPVPEQDHNVNEFLGSASLISQAGRQNQSKFVQDYSDLLNEVTGKFIGYDEDGVRLWAECLMGSVTGNWTPFLQHAYRQKIVSRSHFACTNDSSWGLLRCVLQSMQGLLSEERPAFLMWLKENVLAGDGTFRRLNAVHNIAVSLSSACDLDNVNDQMLALPWEEHFVCLGDLKDIECPGIGSCYHWFQTNIQFFDLETHLHIFIHAAQDTLKALVLYREAEKLFEQGQDETAGIYYRLLYNESQYPEKSTGLTNEKRAEYREIYQSRNRISAAFSGNKAIIEKLEQGLKPRSCFNMLVTMLSTKRAGEIHRLARYFRGANRRLAAEILKIVSPDVEDGEKIMIYKSFYGVDDAVEGLALLMSQKDRNGRYLFLQNGETGRSMYQKYVKQITGRYPHTPPCYLTLSAPPHPSAFAQTESAPEPSDLEQSVLTGKGLDTASLQTNADIIPGFALEIQGRLNGQELPSLEELQHTYEHCSTFEYEKKFTLSGQIYYRLSTESQVNISIVKEALIGYGLDYFAYHTSDSEQSDPLLAFQAERDLALYCKANPTGGTYYRSFIAKVPIALQRMLKSSPSVDALVQDYQLYTRGYDALTGFVESKLPFLVNIFFVIQSLARSYNNINGPKLQNIENYKSAYSGALKQLEGLTIPRDCGEEWLNVRNSLVTKLYDALNSLDQRPDLSVTVLNHKMQGMRRDSIFGELQNTGRERAADIELQATYFDGESRWTGPKYRYANLLPGEKVAFDLNYDVKNEETAVLQYALNVTYYHNQRQMSRAPEKGELTIVPAGPLRFPVDQYATDYPVQFDIDENGTVVGKDFFGREQQMEAMRRTVAGKPFPQFKNFVVRGIRRSGKTSLLNYLETYVGASCQDTIVVRVDCQSIVTQPVQTAFITKVLYALERKLPAATGTAVWRQLVDKWTLSPNEEDRSPDLLQDFYLELEIAMNSATSAQDVAQRTAARKGLFLFIDEFDVMLHRMQSSQRDYILLQGLRTITQSSDCRRAIHFLLCGSNNLISYTRKGERYYQTFQDFTPQIEVDDLPQKDLEEMLLAPYQDDPEVVLLPETLEWVRRYTGGLVWYTKLLGNQMIKEAREKQRGVVYPSDVCRAFPCICNGSCCIQFYEGCEDMEHDVLEALAALSTRYQNYVTLDRLKEQLAAMKQFSADPALEDAGEIKLGSLTRKPLMDGQIADSIEKLIELKLIQRDSAGRDRYCFKREIYRRFFRTQVTRLDKGESLPDQMEDLNISKKKWNAES